jgi:hypothetical protein
MQAIFELHTSRGTININNSDTFIAIAMYFEIMLVDVCSDNHIQLNRLHPIFIVPALKPSSTAKER